MQTVSRSNFTTVKTEGRDPAGRPLAAHRRRPDLDGLRPEDYHLAPNERLNEAINRAWNRCWACGRPLTSSGEQLAATDSGTTLTRERWLLILFQELGYGRLPFQRSVELEDGVELPHQPRVGACAHPPGHLPPGAGPPRPGAPSAARTACCRSSSTAPTTICGASSATACACASCATTSA